MIGLALSGGGLRATFFHLGVINLLYRQGLLPQVRLISSVSGGSIVAAHLVLHWQEYCTGAAFNAPVEARAWELLRFANCDARGTVVRSFIWRWSPSGILQSIYSKQLYQEARLAHLSGDRPDLRIMATDLESGRPYWFTSQGLHRRTSNVIESVNISDQPIALAVTASSAFPLLFPPVVLTPNSVRKRKEQLFNLDRLVLSDGGVYDNLGLEPFLVAGHDCERIIVSDASHLSDSATLPKVRTIRKHLKGVKRALDVTSNRLHEKIVDSIPSGFVRISIRDIVSSTHMAEVDQERIQNVRTDLDRFDPMLVGALAKYGYIVADHAIFKAGLTKSAATNPPWEANLPGTPSLPPQLDSEDFEKANRRRKRLWALDLPTLGNLIIIIAILTALGWLLYPHWPVRPRSISVAQIQSLEAGATTERWIAAHRLQWFGEAEGVGRADIVRVECQPFRRRTTPCCIVLRHEGTRLSVLPFVRQAGDIPVYQPLRFEYAGDSSVRIWLGSHGIGDQIVVLGLFGATEGAPDLIRRMTILVESD